MTLLPWRHHLEAMPAEWKAAKSAVPSIDLLVVDLRDPTVAELLLAFPLDKVKPTLIYYRTILIGLTSMTLVSRSRCLPRA